jgi:hypothetical protein
MLIQRRTLIAMAVLRHHGIVHRLKGDHVNEVVGDFAPRRSQGGVLREREDGAEAGELRGVGGVQGGVGFGSGDGAYYLVGGARGGGSVELCGDCGEVGLQFELE